MIERDAIKVGAVLRWAGDKQLYRVDGFKPYPSGESGVIMRRFIQSRGAWAKVPVSWTSAEQMVADDRWTLEREDDTK